MICKFCGNTIEDNSDFCFICGQKVIPDVAPAAEQEIFSQAAPEAAPEAAPAPAPAPVATEPAAAPIYAQQAPVYAQQAPIYAQQAYVNQAPPPAAKPIKGKKDKSVASKGCKFFAVVFAMTFILQWIPYIWYRNAKKNGYEEKATAILNCHMTGLCIFMAIICVVLVKKFML